MSNSSCLHTCTYPETTTDHSWVRSNRLPSYSKGRTESYLLSFRSEFIIRIVGSRPQRHLEDLLQEILAVHTVPVEQEKELVNLSRQQKFTHTQTHMYARTKWCKATARDYKQNSGLHWKKKISRKSWIKATDPKLPKKRFREPQKRKSCQRNISHCPLRCTTAMAESSTAQRITEIQHSHRCQPHTGWLRACRSSSISSPATTERLLHLCSRK